MTAGLQRRNRATIDEIAQAQLLGSRMTKAEGRPVESPEVEALARRFGLRSIAACVTCCSMQRCEIHGPDRGLAPPKPPKEEKSAIRYARAYAAGQTDASGIQYAAPTTGSDLYHLARMATAHARTKDGDSLAGDTLIAWFRGISSEYRRAIDGTADAKFHEGFPPRRCLAWLNGGRRKGAAPALSTRQAAPARRSRGQEEAI